MRDAVALKRLKPFVEKKGLQIAPARRIALVRSGKVGPRSISNRAVRVDGFVENLPRQHGIEILAAELLRKVKGKSLLESLVLEDCGMSQPGKRWLVSRQLFGLRPQRGPYRVAERELLGW